MSIDKRRIGELGEAAARSYLESKGYLILEQNFRLKCGELDIVAADDTGYVFVEVKTRKNADYGYPSEYVTREKQKKLQRTALLYLAGRDVGMRFDIIEVFYRLDGDSFTVTELDHIEDAF